MESTEDYIKQLPEERREAVRALRNVFRDHLPPGFQEQMLYGMIGFVVPKRTYPAGYHVNPDLPLHFINIASQKSHIALYHSGLYANEDLKAWFKENYNGPVKLNMGKSCVRFKKPQHIPYDFLKELAQK